MLKQLKMISSIKSVLVDRINKNLAKQTFSDEYWRMLNKSTGLLNNYQKFYNFASEYEFIDRSDNAERLVIVVAGYQSDIWDTVLTRINEFSDQEDICVVTPGLVSDELKDISQEYGWSYLSTEENKLSVAQNIAIQEHSSAQYIYKLDEDIFIGREFFDGLYETYKVSENSPYSVGYVAPNLNVNGFSYRYFLKSLGHLGEFKSIFGSIESGSTEPEIYSNSDAARWVWSKTFPIDEKFDTIRESESEFIPIPHKFSIGAILLSRDFWQEIGGFKAAPEGQLGIEEFHLTEECAVRSKVPILSLPTAAGHLGFGPQKEAMTSFYEDNEENFFIID